jgi:cytochrome c553
MLALMVTKTPAKKAVWAMLVDGAFDVHKRERRVTHQPLPCKRPIIAAYNFKDFLQLKLITMKRNALIFWAATAVYALLVSSAIAQAPAGDAKAGAQKVQMCQGCHGIVGWRTAFPEVYHVPKIAGQHPQYFVSALKAYKSGDRKHPSMRAVAQSLSDKDMADLAAYYATESK